LSLQGADLLFDKSLFSFHNQNMGVPLHVLNIEESESDSYTIVHELRCGGYDVDVKRIETEAEFRSVLETEEWDIIISSFYLPDFGGMDALYILRDLGKEIPLVIVSQPFGDNYAALAMRVGAKDFILKNNLSRLVPVVTREIRQVHLNRKHKQVEADLKRKTEQTLAMARISERLNSTLDIQAVIHTICEETVNDLHVSAAAVFLYDSEYDVFHLKGGWQIPPELNDDLAPALLENIPPSNPEKSIYLIPDCREVSGNNHSGFFKALDPCSAMVVKIQQGEELMGLLVATQRTGNRTFSEDEQIFARGLADHAALAFTNAALMGASHRHSDQLLAINILGRALSETRNISEIYSLAAGTILQIIANISTIYISNFNASDQQISCAYGYHDGKPMDVELIPAVKLEPLGSGTQSEAIHTRRPVIINDLRERLKKIKSKVEIGTPGEETQSGLFVPMLVHEQVTGVIQVQSYSLNRFSQEDGDLLGLIANSTAVALENVGLLEETNRHLEQVEALRRIEKSISASIDFHETLKVVLEQAISLLNADAADILLYRGETGFLEFADGRGFKGNGIQSTKLKLGQGLAGRAALERNLVNITSLVKEKESFTRPPLVVEEFKSYQAVPLISKGQIMGVLEVFHRRVFSPDDEWLEFLDALAGPAAIAIDNAQLLSDTISANLELNIAYDETIEGLSRAIDLRDRETGDHSRRSKDMTELLARELGLGEAELIHMRRGALLHDIGKIGVPDSILLKPDKLTDEEWKIMREHPVYAYNFLSDINYLTPALDIPYCHHEKWDGTGYPRGLKGEEIPLAARIFAVIDVWNALHSERPYRARVWTDEEVKEYVRSLSGTHFDPRVVKAFLRLVDQIDFQQL
jgi:response regulator RpfG family c-di-GMP phosphodiesterase/putative methionine-R-sulfoxide reductase with GAF domain